MKTRWFVAAACAAVLAWPAATAVRAETGDEARPAATEDTTHFQAVDELPQVLTKVPPKYPESARKRGQTGTVYVRALVNEQGRTGKVSVIPGKGLAPDLDKAAVEAIRQWTFVPAKVKGKPVEIYITIPVKFRLAEK